LNLNSLELKERFFGLSNLLDLAQLLDVKIQALKYYLYGDESRYETFYIPKKSGGMREILRPNPRLKIVQQRLNNILDIIGNKEFTRERTICPPEVGAYSR